MPMCFTRLQIALLGVVIGLASLVLGRLMQIKLVPLKVAIFHQQPGE
jgi:hypothetical protein